MKAQTLTVIGLGRVGASVGLAVKEKLGLTVVGYDENKARAQTAQAIGAVDVLENSPGRAAARADILVLATPISLLEKSLKMMGHEVQSHTLVLDFSSLKAPGLKWAEQYLAQGHYVGAVPVLAAQWLDDGRLGTEAATADLFQNSVFCLMPAPTADPEAVETAVNFGLVIGARPYSIDPVEFDALAQATETLPGLVAAALFRALQASTAWEDMLRFAGLPFSLATRPLAQNEDIALMAFQNKEATLRWLEAMIQSLQDLRQLIYESEPEVGTAVLEELSLERDKWLLKRKENDWDERKLPEMEAPSLLGSFLGGIGSRSKDKDRKDKKA